MSVKNGFLVSFLCGTLGVSVIGCVGPTTPFGALDSFNTPKKETLREPAKAVSALEEADFFNPDPRPVANLSFSPARQNLHDHSKLKVIVDDPLGIPAEALIRVYYNGYNVSERFNKSVRQVINPERTRLTLEFSDLVLLAHKDNKIQFTYKRNGQSEVVTNEFYPPDCELNEKKSLANTGSFRPPESYLKSLNYWSNKYDVNPALLAGLIAQESSFDPKAVSWSKAVGLTQVTNLADQDVARTHKSWPRSSLIKRYPATVVKGLIRSGKINSKHDWRLDPAKSIHGGITYLQYLTNYWKNPKNYKKLEKNFSHPEEVVTDVILASYNSGAARVKYAIDQYGQDYLSSNKLGEARKYVRKINSYCYHFAQGEVQ